MKYNMNLLMKYIHGEYIDEDTILELENDYQFMIKVINYTNDKSIYDRCSDDVKSTYDFVLFLIGKFKNDQEFISHVVDEYMEEERDSTKILELLINVSKLSGSQYSKYREQLDTIYEVERFNINAFKMRCDDKELLRKLQEGFLFIIDEFNESNIIMNFYAKRFIKDIFEKCDINLEREVHNKFKKYDDLVRYGINNFLIELLMRYDSCLAGYVTCHINLLDDIKKDFDRIKLNWDSYNDDKKKLRLNKRTPILKLVPRIKPIDKED